MDLKSCLLPNDLFVSYWLDDQLTLIAGDQNEIILAEHSNADGLPSLIRDFERYVAREDHYTTLLSDLRRSSLSPPPVTSASAFNQLCRNLSVKLVPPRVQELLSSGRYRRLLLFPDGVLNALPLDLLISFSPFDLLKKSFPDGVVYAPSASAYVYAQERRRQRPWRNALILLGDVNDKCLIDEAQRIARGLSCQSNVLSTMTELHHYSEKADLIYVASHGSAPNAEDRGKGWSILFDNGALQAEHFYREHIKLERGAVVVISACSVGRLTVGPAHEVEGLIHALFYGGAASVLAARWPVLYEAADAVFLGTINAITHESGSLSAALRNAIRNCARQPSIISCMASPEAALFFLGAFALFGCGE